VGKKLGFIFAILSAVLLTVPDVQARSGQVVIGYSATWYDETCPPEYYNYDGLTYLGRCFLTPRPAGSISVPGNFFDAKMEDLARQHGVKLTMSLGGEASDANNWLSIARHPEYFKRFCDEVGQLLKDHNYDGIDIDWEPSALTNEDGAAFCSFLKGLREAFPKAIITTALGTGDYWISHFPSWPDIYNSVDYINVMAYVYSGSWGGVAGHDSPLYPAGAYKSDAGLSDDEGLKNLTEHYKVPKEKLLLGLDFWGDQFHVAHMGDAFPKNQPGQGGEISFPDVMQLRLTGAYEEKWDAKAQVPYLERKEPGHVVSYENEKSIQAKCEYASKMGLAGVMVWHVGSDVWGNRAPLMDTVAKSTGSPLQTFPHEFLLKQVGVLSGQANERKTYLDQMNQAITAGGGKVTPAPWTGAYSPSALAQLSDDEIEKTRLGFEKTLGTLQSLIAKAQDAFQKAPTPKGKALDYGQPLLLDDFETGTTTSKLGTSWTVDLDHNNLGTDIKNASAFIVPKGAHKSKFCVRVYGHYGRSMAPWPYATLTCNMDAAGGAVDLSGFKSIEFWVKGDGKTYEIVMDNPKVLDYANFRSEFTAPKKWTKVILTLDSFHQPNWGAQVNRDMGAVKRITFEPSGMNDEDFDFSIDDVTFIP
jgi:chitinase